MPKETSAFLFYFAGMNSCVISLSSNFEAKKNLLRVEELLKDKFPDISFSTQIETLPFGAGYKANFLNCVALFSCADEQKNIKILLKQIEINQGRTPELKVQKIVPIDLDIILWNGEVVHNDYFRFPFLSELIRKICPA